MKVYRYYAIFVWLLGNTVQMWSKLHLWNR